MSEKLHIIPHDHQVNRQDRRRLHGHHSLVIWFVGLSGSGKSTLANRVEQALFARGCSTYILDGDNIRAGLNRDLDFSEAARVENIRRIGEVARLMVDAGVITLTAFITPFAADRQAVRKMLGAENYLEIYVDCPLEECEKRDVKGLYAKARRGEISNFTGISSPFEAPQDPDVTVQTARMSIDQATDKILNAIYSKIKIRES